MRNHVLSWTAMVGVVLSGCSQSPSSPSAFADPPAVIDAGTAEQQLAQVEQLFADMQRFHPLTDHEDFDCTHVEEVRVRLSDPGFIDGPRVGLFVKFVGIPAGTKTLRIWWDYENDFGTFQDIAVGDGDVNPENPALSDIEMVIEHTYDVTETVTRVVRVELMLEDETGNCARNRHIVVSPEFFDHVVTFAGVPTCFSFAGSRSMGLRANFIPPIPAGTTYRIRARVTATGVTSFVGTFTMFGNTAGPDFVSSSDVTPPPNEFSVNLTSTVPHRQLQIAATISTFAFAAPTSMAVRIVNIEVPGKKVHLASDIVGFCP